MAIILIPNKEEIVNEIHSEASDLQISVSKIKLAYAMTEQNCKRQMIVITTLTSQRSSCTTFAGDDTQPHQSRTSNQLPKMLSIKPVKSCSIPR